MLNDRPDQSDQAERLEAMRERLRAGMRKAAAEQDRSWRFQIARQVARVPVPALAAAAIFICCVIAYGVWQTTEHVQGIVATAAVEAGALPIRALTPGATARVTADDLCAGAVLRKSRLPRRCGRLCCTITAWMASPMRNTNSTT